MNANLKKVIKDLEAEEARIQAKKDLAKRSAIAEINQVIAIFGLKASELDFSGKAPTRAAAKAAAPKAKRTRSDAGKKIEPKYMAPDGSVWTGRGRKPRAIADALAEGYSLEDMLIKKNPVSANAS